MLRISLIFCFAFLPSLILAHSGGLNANGCHGGSRPYHCHRRPTEMVVTSTGHNRLRCDLGSRSAECRQGYKVQTKANVLNIQIQLRRHCSGLNSNFADGRMGANTKRVLVEFQRSQGLQADGIYGAATASALSRAPNGRCRLATKTSRPKPANLNRAPQLGGNWALIAACGQNRLTGTIRLQQTKQQQYKIQYANSVGETATGQALQNNGTAAMVLRWNTGIVTTADLKILNSGNKMQGSTSNGCNFIATRN